jgi:hypothetical protein
MQLPHRIQSVLKISSGTEPGGRMNGLPPGLICFGRINPAVTPAPTEIKYRLPGEKTGSDSSSLLNTDRI